ncbi:MAG: hypothetical protein HY434_00360 [Candidatus Liptonbacteria bacterium]|nr:hypothetical protein [Candidatus Liptonbacteria bacterium]
MKNKVLVFISAAFLVFYAFAADARSYEYEDYSSDDDYAGYYYIGNQGNDDQGGGGGDEGGGERGDRRYGYEPVEPEPEPESEQEEVVADYQCNRRGHNASKSCDGDTVSLNNTESITVTFTGERFGSSMANATVCVMPANGDVECSTTYRIGSQLGEERSDPGLHYEYIPPTTLNCGGSCMVIYYSGVTNANSRLRITATGQVVQESAYHSACSGRSCVQVEGDGRNECSGDSSCVPQNPCPNPPCTPTPTHYECTGCWSCSRVSGAGSDSCTSGSQCYCPIILPTISTGGGRRAPSLEPPPSCALSASPDRFLVPPPRNVTLSWFCLNAQGCTISPEVGSVGANGNAIVSVSRDTTYIMNCSGRGGSRSYTATVRAFEWAGGKLKEVAP